MKLLSKDKAKLRTLRSHVDDPRHWRGEVPQEIRQRVSTALSTALERAKAQGGDLVLDASVIPASAHPTEEERRKLSSDYFVAFTATVEGHELIRNASLSRRRGKVKSSMAKAVFQALGFTRPGSRNDASGVWHVIDRVPLSELSIGEA